MKVVEAVQITEAMLMSSSLAEDDYPAWDVSTEYTGGDYVIHNHRIWYCVLPLTDDEGAAVSTTGLDPSTDTEGTTWADQGATNLWRPFDFYIANQAYSNTGSITYTIQPGEVADVVAFFGIEGEAVTVRAIDGTGTVYEETKSPVDNSEVVDAWTYRFEPIKYRSELVFDGVPIFSDTSIEIEVTSATDVRLGQISIGKLHPLGVTIEGTSISFTDFSEKARNIFGGVEFVERDSADKVTYNFTAPTEEARRVKNIITRLRATPSIWLADSDTDNLGTTIFGWVSSFDCPLTVGVSYINLEIEGLT